MALKRYAATSVATGGASTITFNNTTIQMVNVLTVPASNECAVVNFTLNGGASGGLVAIGIYRNSELLDQIQLSVAAGDSVFVETKEFLEAGDVLRFGASNAGVTLAVSCDVSAIA